MSENAENKNMNIYEQGRTVPAEALKKIEAGRLKGFSDINPMWRIKKLTELFGPCGIGWRIEIIDQRIEDGHGDTKVCFVDIHLYVKVDGEWSYPIHGSGGSSFIAQERNGLYTSDECFKMAQTDAIGGACKLLGIAADVYFEKDRTKYNTQGEQEESSKQTASNNKKEHDRIMAEIKGKWLTLGGKEEGLQGWIEEQTEKGKSYSDMNAILTKNIQVKQAEAKKKEGTNNVK